ncbi:hypothetical protein [Leptospira sp. GIMC2001]|uniref:hypothetical protein n=1 Tax=Leptospira sp. GIMC2001 TaxID=1513297 RepID=UPI00234B4B7B|nr:hypothetical protein [Leptospira sp. GIMC2001]WCL47909.1 hypothetical protein O4O04_11300 [Leptospira sp. GIMC2001]
MKRLPIKLFIIYFSSLFLLNPVIQPPLLIGPEDIFYNPSSTLKPGENKKKNNDPTKWGGSSLTQSEKSFQGIPVTTFTLGGGAWIYHNDIKLTSSIIEIFGEDAIRADLKGRVVVQDTSNGTTLSASKGYYDKLSDKITLEGTPRLLHVSPEKKRTRISAAKIVRYLDEGKTILEGKVYVENEDYTVVGENATYLDDTKKMIISGSPFLFSDKRFLSGKSLIYDTDSGEVALEDGTFLIQKSLEKKESKSNDKIKNSKSKSTDTKDKNLAEQEEVLVTTISIADKMFHQSTGDNKSTGLIGNAMIIRPDNEFYADSLKRNITNNEGEIIEAKKNVRIIDLENHVILTGGFMEHFKEREYSHLTENPKIEVMDKENEKIQSTITAIEIERFMDRKEIVTRGNVKIESETSIARGEYATYYEEEEKIVLEGDPSIERDKKILHSGKIIIYPQDDRVLLSEGMNLKGSE